jgi:hypothetical protein
MEKCILTLRKTWNVQRKKTAISEKHTAFTFMAGEQAKQETRLRKATGCELGFITDLHGWKTKSFTTDS